MHWYSRRKLLHYFKGGNIDFLRSVCTKSVGWTVRLRFKTFSNMKLKNHSSYWTLVQYIHITYILMLEWSITSVKKKHSCQRFTKFVWLEIWLNLRYTKLKRRNNMFQSPLEGNIFFFAFQCWSDRNKKLKLVCCTQVGCNTFRECQWDSQPELSSYFPLFSCSHILALRNT